MSSVVELYLLQLKSLLPRRRRDDLFAEIRASIETAVAERERALGRKLDDAEAREVLQAHGHPIAVAGRYLPMQYLIGPRVFPLYWYAVQAVLIVIATSAGIVTAVALFTDPRATQAAIQVLVRFFWIALDAAALVTLSFMLVDRQHGRFRLFEDFGARSLGAGLLGARARLLGENPSSSTAIELAAVGILLLWWTGWLVLPSVQFDVEVERGAALTTLHAPVIALCVVDLVRLGVDLVHPYRTAQRIGVAIASNLIRLVLLANAVLSDDLLQAAPSIQDPAEIERVVTIAERTFRIVLVGLGAWTAGRLALDLRRLLRRA